MPRTKARGYCRVYLHPFAVWMVWPLGSRHSHRERVNEKPPTDRVTQSWRATVLFLVIEVGHRYEESAGPQRLGR